MCLVTGWRRLLFFITISFLIHGVNSFAGEESSTDKQVKNVFGAINMANGYATYNHQILPSSAVGEYQVITSSPEGSVQFELIDSRKSLEEELGIHASVEVPVKAVKVKNIASFVNSYDNSKRSISLIYKADWGWRYSLEPAGDKPVALSSEAKSLYESSKSTFLSTYGNAFVTKARAGVALYLMVRIHFSSSEDKTEFESRIEAGKEDIASVAASLHDFTRKNKCDGSMSVRALQLGGNPAQLAEIFKEESGAKGTAVTGKTGKDKNDSGAHGVEAQGFDLKSEEIGNNIITQAINYISTLSTQVSKDKPDTLFYFGDINTTSYHALDNSIGLHSDGMLDDETLAARKDILEGYRFLKQVRQLAIPFYTYTHFVGSFDPIMHRFMSKAVDYRKNLEEFFNTSSVTAQFLCFQAGSESGMCAQAARVLKTIMPENQNEFIKQLHKLNFSVGVADRFAGYPIELPTIRSDGRLEQRLSSFELNKPNARLHGVIVDVQGDPAASLYDIVTGEEVQKIRYCDSFLPECREKNYLGRSLANKEDASVFIKEEATPYGIHKGDKITFHDDFYFPYPSGHVCLHLPAGAAFAGKIKNMRTGHEQSVFEFATKKIRAQVGDVIQVAPALGSKASRHTFRVTAPYDTGHGDDHEKLPLHTTLHLKGTVMKSHYNLIYNDRDCY